MIVGDVCIPKTQKDLTFPSNPPLFANGLAPMPRSGKPRLSLCIGVCERRPDVARGEVAEGVE